MFYTYIWKDAAGVPFYVGKGSGRRSTYLRNRSPEFKDIHSLGGCTMDVVDEFILESEAHAHEMDLIDRYGRREFGGLLVNKTDGGEGMSGHVHSAEARAKIAAAGTGRKHTPETIAKMRVAKSNVSQETRAKISKAKTGKPHSEETRTKLSASHTGKTLSTETRAKIGDATRGKPLSAEHRAKLRENSASGRPEVRAKISASHVGLLHTPEARAKMSIAHTGKIIGDEWRANMSAERRMRPAAKGRFKGVSFDKSSQKWEAGIALGGKRRRLGWFTTQEEAARSYDAAAYAAWGSSCYLNFPPLADNDNHQGESLAA